MKENYRWTFFFYLDIFATLSMIPDCEWIYDNFIDGISTKQDTAVNIARTSRAARVTRIVRVIRLVRLIRIVKMYK